ncbi:hypothetical protein CsatB_004860 [Cannabis sativa]|uniref:Uncharacterized protein n=2 Tax=Cannabis sativa TaxID=3483 RepID=A0A7J6E3V9_CANSA|nr:uncharacterized protein LOC115715611 [Cannabis sativa]KAF4353103.1 hypothetical protein F8388_016948 [Cannabis sativa]KAF4389514.1 hypothetical protein G4B88_006573 [Cannabis sativa]
MKASGTLVASVLAASTVAFGSSAGTRDVSLDSSSNQDFSSCSGRKSSPKTTSDKEKFSPRFDGLRFIETLVTAHR